MERLLTAAEAAELLGLTERAVQDLMKNGEIECLSVSKRPGGPRPKLRTTESRLERWVQRRAEEQKMQQFPKTQPARRKRRADEVPPGMERTADGQLRIARRH